MTSRQIKNTRTRQERDQATWVGETQILVEYTTEGQGELTSPVEFGVVFPKRPFFTWHVELLSGELVPGDFPAVTAFVNEWVLSGKGYYTGALVSVRVSAATRYQLGFLFSFVGESFRGPVE
jgi:hypothetical protein